MYWIRDAIANPDFTVMITWKHGPTTVVDFKGNIERGGVCVALADPVFFVNQMYIGEEGYHLGWPEEIDFSADSLWYRTHPEDLMRDYPGVAAE